MSEVFLLIRYLIEVMIATKQNSSMTKAHYLVLFLLILSIIFIVSGNTLISDAVNISLYDSKRFNQIALLLVCPIIFLAKPLILTKNKTILILLIIFLSCGAISSLLSSNIIKSFSGWWLLFTSIFIIIQFSNANSKVLPYYFSGLISFAAFLYAIYFFLSILLDYYHTTFNAYNSYLFHGFDNPRFLSQVQTWAIAYCVLFTYYLKSKLYKTDKIYIRLLYILSIFTCISYMCISFITGARGTLLSYLFATTLIWVIYGKSFNYLGKKIIFYWCISFALYLAIITTLPYTKYKNDASELTNITSTSSLESRFQLWSHSINSIVKNPSFGIGPMMYSSVSDKHNHPHNSILWLATEWGLISTIAFIILLLFLLAKYISTIRDASLKNNGIDMHINTGQIISLILCASAIHSQISGLYLMPGSQLFILLTMITAILNYNAICRSNTDATSSVPSKYISRNLLILIILITLSIPTLTYTNQPTWNSRFDLGIRTYPGFWENGDL